MEAIGWQFLVSLFGGALAGLIMSYIRIRMYEKEREKTERQLFVHRLQFEKEFEIYTDLWKSCVELTVATLDLRPIFELGSKETDVEKLKRKLETISVAFNSFQDIVFKHKPFYAQDIFAEAEALSTTAHKEWIEFQAQDRHSVDYWKSGIENLKIISTHADAICAAIRRRILSTH